MIKENAADKAKFIPKTGFNVVGVDDFELPGERLYIIGHFNEEKSAAEAMSKFKRENPGETVHIYDPETK